VTHYLLAQQKHVIIAIQIGSRMAPSQNSSLDDNSYHEPSVSSVSSVSSLNSSLVEISIPFVPLSSPLPYSFSTLNLAPVI